MSDRSDGQEWGLPPYSDKDLAAIWRAVTRFGTVQAGRDALERVAQKLPDGDYSPAYQDEYQRLWHEAAKARDDLASLRRCDEPMPESGSTPMFACFCDLWPGHDGPHRNAATASEWGEGAGKIYRRCREQAAAALAAFDAAGGAGTP